MSLHLITGYAGTEHITAADQGSLHVAMLGEGEYVLDRGNKFSASIISNNVVKLLDGDVIMQGRHIRLNENTYVELNFENGTQGYLRNDLIVARYTKDSTTGVESCAFEVIQGTPAESEPTDPEYTTGDIVGEQATINDMLLYRVPFDGINMQELVPLFEVMSTLKEAVNTAQSTANSAQTTADTAVTNASTAQTTANNAMPKSGGTFTGNTIAYSTNRNSYSLRNSIIQNSSGTAVSTNSIIFQRK